MKIQYCSDLHLEFRENKEFLIENPLIPKADILLLAGDIVPLRFMNIREYFFDYVSNNFQTTYWIPGNHEYYHGDIRVEPVKPLYFSSNVRDNVIILNNQSVIHNNVELIFTTLWSHIPPQQELMVEQSVSDFRLIENKGEKFTIDDFNLVHDNDLDFLKTTLAKPTDKQRVIVTHHVPTLMNYPEQYKNSNINSAFAVELYDLIEDSKAAYWIYGHHHCNTSAFKIGNTTMLTNQLGYVRENEHQLFNHSATFEI